MKRFILQLARFLSVILASGLILILLYVHFDPFQVVNKYKSFYRSGKPRYVTLNADYVAVETFLNNYPIYKYDSFIIGNSRSRFYEVSAWRKYIDSDRCFHFDASSESLYGISKKVELLDKKNVNIKNAIIILDYNTLMQVTNSKGHLYIKHPILSGQSVDDFHLEFFKAFCSFKFLPAYLDFKMSGKIKGYMKSSGLLDDTPIGYDSKTNEMNLKMFEDSIKVDPGKFYNERRMKHFYSRDNVRKISPKVIRSEQIAMLRGIKATFRRNFTNYKIIINPLYDQIELNKEDLVVLKKIFGEENVFDYSGINRFTRDYTNYYEESHYRPNVAREILREIYRMNNN